MVRVNIRRIGYCSASRKAPNQGQSSGLIFELFQLGGTSLFFGSRRRRLLFCGSCIAPAIFHGFEARSVMTGGLSDLDCYPFIAALIASTPLPDFAASMICASLAASFGAAAFMASIVLSRHHHGAVAVGVDEIAALHRHAVDVHVARRSRPRARRRATARSSRPASGSRARPAGCRGSSHW